MALIPGAALIVDGVSVGVSGSDGRFRVPCLPQGQHTLVAKAEGFAEKTLAVSVPHAGEVDVVLVPELTTEVEVSEDDATTSSPTASGPSQRIEGKQLQQLADDPDDLQRELQQMAAASGGNPANTTISVDGFQGGSALPPKSSIAYIEVNPDQFSAEYREPPFEGGRVEVYTKPGQKTFHGALFATNGSAWMNARDPFSVSKGALGKQRYGFELSGPVTRKGSDFALSLEHRSIDNVAAVDAVTLAGTTLQTVPTPQRLWLGTARVDWQLGAKNTFIASYSASVNQLTNVGVGGTTLAEAGYASSTYDHAVRLSDVTTVSANVMHEARVSVRWVGHDETPGSTAPQVQVSGAFTGGGASVGAQQVHKMVTEVDDDAILTPKGHTIKFGTQLLIRDEHNRVPLNFNGTYVFQDLAHYAAGVADAYTGVTGTPVVDFTQLTDAVFVQDDWNVGHGVHIAGGVRYYFEVHPTVLNGATPRLGVLWSPDKKGRWTLHAHGGLFTGQYGDGDEMEVLREDGVHRVTSTVYNPVVGAPFAGAPTVIRSMREFSPHISNLTWGGWNVGGTRALPGGWNVSLDYYDGRIWNDERTENINSPLNGSPTGPRPGAANLNVLQVQNSGQGTIGATFLGVEQHNWKRLQLFAGAVRVNLVDDTDDSTFFTPQSSTSDAGEFAHRTGQQAWNVFGNATLTLPGKVQVSTVFNAGGDSHYNITTGFDNNGDGDFNDRPQYAAPGTPGAVQTPFGLLVASGGTAVFPRNKGQLPWVFYVDMNVQRAFALTSPKAEHPQTITVNLRSSNVLNHENVTAEGGVLGSPLFGVPYAADNGRRVEAGVRYSF
jgi:hypothetical protein